MSDTAPHFVHCGAANREVSYRRDGLGWLVEVWEGAKVIDTRNANSKHEAEKRARYIAAAMEPRRETHEQPELL